MPHNEPGLEHALVLVGLGSVALIGGAAASSGHMAIAVLSLGALVGQMVGLRRLDTLASGRQEAHHG